MKLLDWVKSQKENSAANRVSESSAHLGLILEDVTKTYEIVREEDNSDI